jgi:hypothetical protein
MKTTVLYLFGIMVATALWTAVRSDAKVIQAASCQYADVSNAVAQASPGDVVQLPPGTNWWAQTITLNGVSIEGAGTNLTVLTDEENRAVSSQMINLNPVAGYFSEVCNIQFCGGVTNTSENYWGTIAVAGVTGSEWRIDHNVFNQLYAKNICTTGNAFSLIDHNTFYERNISIEDNSYMPNDQFGDQSWSSPPTYGIESSNVLYVENNYFTNTEGYVGSVGATDGEGGGRIVFRYNIVINDCFNNHGTESGGRLRSERSFEIYDNTFTCPPGSSLYQIYAACMIRGGSGVIYSNTINGYEALAAIRSFRYTCSYLSEWAPFGGADGLSAYDSNDPTLYLTGTSAGPSGSDYLQVNGANWAINQWVGYSVLNVNSGLFSLITSNNANNIYDIGTGSSASLTQCTVLTFNNGDTFQIHRVYAALDQPGRGSGDLLVDQGVSPATGILVTIDQALGLAAWPREVLEGIYSWGNTVDGADGTLFSFYPTIQAGRDFFNDTPKPNYTPYTYPHPLEFVSVGSTNSSSPTNNPSTNGLVPPTGLHLIQP